MYIFQNVLPNKYLIQIRAVVVVKKRDLNYVMMNVKMLQVKFRRNIITKWTFNICIVFLACRVDQKFCYSECKCICKENNYVDCNSKCTSTSKSHPMLSFSINYIYKWIVLVCNPDQHFDDTVCGCKCIDPNYELCDGICMNVKGDIYLDKSTLNITCILILIFRLWYRFLYRMPRRSNIL